MMIVCARRIDPELLTGATGLIGHAIARRLLAAGWCKRALARDPKRVEALGLGGIEPIAGDLTNRDFLDRAVAGSSVVIHAAGLPEQRLADPSRFDRVNHRDTVALAEQCKDAGIRLVSVSTIDVFTITPGQPFDETLQWLAG